MPLTKEDLESIGQLFDQKVKSLNDSFKESLENMGKRVRKLEDYVSDMARVARRAVIEIARDKHDSLLRSMFDESTLVAVPPLQQGQEGKMSRPVAACSIDDVRNKLSNVVGADIKFELEPTNVGFRIMLASFSAQARRKSAASIVQSAKKELQESLGLLLQYDKPYELRKLQKEAYKFMAVLQKRHGGKLQSKALKNGYLVVNGIRIAPEYLIPGPGRWDELADAVGRKVSAWRSRPPANVETGVMTDFFGYIFAEDKGILELDLSEEEHMASDEG
jgi:hypothetical protein